MKLDTLQEKLLEIVNEYDVTETTVKNIMNNLYKGDYTVEFMSSHISIITANKGYMIVNSIEGVIFIKLYASTTKINHTPLAIYVMDYIKENYKGSVQQPLERGL